MAVSLFMTYFLWMKFELNSLNFNKPRALRLFEFFFAHLSNSVFLNRCAATHKCAVEFF